MLSVPALSFHAASAIDTTTTPGSIFVGSSMLKVTAGPEMGDSAVTASVCAALPSAGYSLTERSAPDRVVASSVVEAGTKNSMSKPLVSRSFEPIEPPSIGSSSSA